jgi:hypothetical protein
MTQLKTIGKKIFQPININWSNRNLGKFARIKTKINATTIILKPKKKS